MQLNCPNIGNNPSYTIDNNEIMRYNYNTLAFIPFLFHTPYKLFNKATNIL